MTPRTVLGAGLVVAGVIMALLFGDLEFLWFRGGPLGLVLVVLGVLDILDGLRRRRGASPPTLRDDMRPRSR